MNISVLGCGRWGSFHAWYADHIGHAVTLWGRKGSRHLAALVEQRKNEYLTLPDSVQLTDDLAGAVASADILVISISSQQLRSFCRDLVALGIDLSGKRFVLCMKGLEIGTGNSGFGQIALYERCGFVRCGIDEDYFRKHFPAPIFENGVECRHMVRLRMEFM